MLISQNQREANRRNALLSTGPKTVAGKAAVRLNALRHGLRARTVLLPGENAAEFHQLCADLESEWNPQTRTAQLLVEQMAVAQWKLARLETGERSIFVQSIGAERQMALLDRFSIQRSRLERAFSNAVRALRQYRASSGVLASSVPPESKTAGRPPESANLHESSGMGFDCPECAPPPNATECDTFAKFNPGLASKSPPPPLLYW